MFTIFHRFWNFDFRLNFVVDLQRNRVRHFSKHRPIAFHLERVVNVMLTLKATELEYQITYSDQTFQRRGNMHTLLFYAVNVNYGKMG